MSRQKLEQFQEQLKELHKLDETKMLRSKRVEMPRRGGWWPEPCGMIVAKIALAIAAIVTIVVLA